jgi:hypothetical protein
MIPSFGVVPEVSATDIVGFGSGLTVMVRVVDALHPSLFVTTTVYVVVVVGDTVIADVVAPLDQA